MRERGEKMKAGGEKWSLGKVKQKAQGPGEFQTALCR